jgi:N-acyl amino acid synthase of PEP-CTERM/exosortase system
LTDLVKLSSQYFASRLARTAEEFEEVYRLRYKVYCKEAAYFDSAHFPDGLEKDIYDDRSVQGMVVYRPTNTIIGTVRLILPPSDCDSLSDLPFDMACGPDLAEGLKMLPRESSAEISRFCITRDLVKEIANTPSAAFDLVRSISEDRDFNPLDLARQAKIWLMRAIVESTATHNITHWCAVMEPFLLRSLGRLGVRFSHLGPPVDYYGERQPCFDEVDSVMNVIKLERRDVWELITDSGHLYL